MYRDSPDDYLFEAFSGQVFSGHPLGRPVIGYEETVSSFERADLYDYMNDRYQPWNLLVSVAGNVEHQEVVDIVSGYFGEIAPAEKEDSDQNITPYTPRKWTLSKPIEQAHLILGRRGLDFNHEKKYQLLLANTVLGQGMSSRLHQNVREKYGYCYTISTFNQSYRDTGLFGIYVGTDINYSAHVSELIKKELNRLREESIPEKELEEAKAQDVAPGQE